MSVILLDELFNSLLYKKGKEQMTKQETKIYQEWKSQALKSFAVGGAVVTGLTWIVTRRLNSFNRVTLAGGAGFLTGIVRLNESIDSCVDQILCMDGSRMQQELKKIILEKYGNNPMKMQPFSKHFYCEEVFNDSILGRPQPVFRQRHLYVEDYRTANANTLREAVKRGFNNQQRNDDSKVGLKSPSADIKQAPVPSISIFGYGDPLDVLFGHSPANEELQQPDESGNSAKVQQSHRQKRVRRKHRLHNRNQESDSLSLGMAQLQGV